MALRGVKGGGYITYKRIEQLGITEDDLQTKTLPELLSNTTAPTYESVLAQVNATSLTPDESAALKTYTTHAGLLNDALRSGKKLKGADAKYVKALDAALEKLPSYEGTVYRGLRIRQENLPAFLGALQAQTVTFPAFTSSSIDTKQVSPFAVSPYDGYVSVTMTMTSKRGKAVFSKSVQPHQKEVLFSRNTAFTVKQITQTDGSYSIHLEEA